MLQGEEISIFQRTIAQLDPTKPITVPSGTSMRQVLDALQDHHIGCVLVTKAEKLIGIVTERDFLNHIMGQIIDLNHTPVDKFMTPNPETLKPNDMVAFAMNRMNLGGYRHIPLVDNQQRPIGIVSVKDIVNFLVDEFPASVLNLPPEPHNFPKTREGA